MSKPAFLTVTLLSLGLIACANVGQEPELTKDEVRSFSDQEKADHNFDWCEEFDWYGDGVCDVFCLEPDPDCQAVCLPADCGPQPEFQPRVCDDGTLIFPSVTCENDPGFGCGWNFEQADCPEPVTCEPADCGPQPSFQPRVCDDGSFIFPNVTCENDPGFGCGWNFEQADCPEDSCDEESIELAPNASCSADAGVFGPFASSCSCPTGFEYGGASCGMCEPIL